VVVLVEVISCNRKNTFRSGRGRLGLWVCERLEPELRTEYQNTGLTTAMAGGPARSPPECCLFPLKAFPSFDAYATRHGECVVNMRFACILSRLFKGKHWKKDQTTP
jgi:hypothetical protein